MTGIPVLRARRSLARGQALVEFALVVIPMLLLFLGILQYAFIFGTQIGLENSAREAARYAAASSTDASTAAANGGRVISKLETATTGLLVRNIQPYDPSNLVKAGGTQVCYSSYQDESGSYSVRVKVDVVYRHPLFIPLISAIIDGLDGTTDSHFRVGVSEEMRVDNAPFLTDPGVSTCAS